MGLLDGRIAIVTGSGRGIGKATALRFAREGAKVVVSDLDEAPAQETAQEIKSAGGEACRLCRGCGPTGFRRGNRGKSGADVGRAPHPGEQRRFHLGRGGPQDDRRAVGDHAGRAPHRPFSHHPGGGPFFPRGRQAGKSSGEGGQPEDYQCVFPGRDEGNSGQANYASAKAGVVGLARALAKEWGPLNVQVNAVAYGWIDTRLTKEKEAGQTLERDGKAIAIGIPAGTRNIMHILIPLGRAGTPEEAAGPILFLASPLSDYVSGQCLEVTGGFFQGLLSVLFVT